MSDFAKKRERDSSGKFVIPTVPSGFDTHQYRLDYYQKNKQKKLAYVLNWARNNKEKRKLYKDRWRAKNKERTNFLTRQYHYRKKHASGSISFEELQKLMSLIPVCIYCNTNKSTTIDHVIPLSRGGTNNIDNLLPSCVSCNSKKRNKTLSEWNPMLFVQLNSIGRYGN